MAYDRDSFLSGLAVGRTLWKPYTISLTPVPKYKFSYTVGWNSTFTYRIYIEARGLLAVQWGDGTSTEVEAKPYPESTTLSHNYASSGVYQITLKIYDWAYRLIIGSLYSDGYGKYILSIDSPIPSCFNQLLRFCQEATNLLTIPSNLFSRVPNLNSLSQAFTGSGITALPSGLLDNCPNIVDFDMCFARTSIVSIPSGLFDYCIQAEDFDNTFQDCVYLQSIPLDLFDHCPNVRFLSYTFGRCSSIVSSVPELWNKYPSAYGHGCYYGCENALNYADIPYSWRAG